MYPHVTQFETRAMQAERYRALRAAAARPMPGRRLWTRPAELGEAARQLVALVAPPVGAARTPTD
jgi:hypothetical protein